METIKSQTQGAKPPIEEESFESLFLESIKNEKEIKEGHVVPGTVMKVGTDFVMIDIGYKSEGRIHLGEFTESDGTVTVKVGDKIDVFLESTEDDQGLVSISKEKADKLKIWDEIAEVCERGEVIEGRIIERVKGGVAVDIGVKAFLPGSQIDLNPTRDLDHLIGKTFQFKIIKFNKTRGNIVLSRRVLLEQERHSQREKTLKVLEEGSVMKGTVKNITDYGAFIDLGGIDGLLHITDISWKRINHPSEILKVGETIDVKVLKFDQEKERVSLGYKQMSEDPWADADMRHAKNSKVSGKVVSLTDYGAFIEVQEGVEGLIHVSEMSWTKRVKHPSAILTVGQVVEAVVLDIDKENRRMSLGLKQTQENPWDALVKKYPPGTRITGEIRNITDFGLFVAVEEDIDGLVHISDLSWSAKIKNPHDVYKKGEKVQAVVLNVDPSAERFSLGIKQLADDPWRVALEKYPLGSSASGEIVKITDFGLFVRLDGEDDIEALVHISEVANEKIANLNERFKVGDKVNTMVLSIDSEERKMSLSIKNTQLSDDQKAAVTQRVKQAQAVVRTPTLGDLMDEGLKKQPRRKKKKSEDSETSED